MTFQQLSPNLYRYTDTCHTYVVKVGNDAILIDMGTGEVLQQLSSIGVTQVNAVLMTHHHRDNAHGLPHAVAAGIPIYVPHTEAPFFNDVEAYWQGRNVDDNYNVRQDRFTLLNSVPIAGTLDNYTEHTFNGQAYFILPAPSHTPGSIAVLTHLDGKYIAFTGDLIAAPGKVWSMAATQWTYNQLEGISAGFITAIDLAQRQLDQLLPCHGDIMDDPQHALQLLATRFEELMAFRGVHKELREVYRQPFRVVLPHLLLHWMIVANTFVLLSESGKAMLFDFGYDMFGGFADGTDRSSRFTRLYSIPILKQHFNISHIEAVVATHYHDDHVAGFNLLRRVEGTQVWAAENFADILENPKRYDLPCLWFEPIPVDRHMPLETPVQWEEYTLTMYALPGHTRYAVAIALEVDGKRVIITGDQYQGEDIPDSNYVYANRFAADDFVQSAALYRRLAPDIILTGHWQPIYPTPEYFDRLDALGEETARRHRELLVEGIPNDDFIARIMPYQSFVSPNDRLVFEVEVTNPHVKETQVTVQPVLPPHLTRINHDPLTMTLPALATGSVTFEVLVASPFNARRAVISADVTMNQRRYGQVCEALITLG